MSNVAVYLLLGLVDIVRVFTTNGVYSSKSAYSTDLKDCIDIWSDFQEGCLVIELLSQPQTSGIKIEPEQAGVFVQLFVCEST